MLHGGAHSIYLFFRTLSKDIYPYLFPGELFFELGSESRKQFLKLFFLEHTSYHTVSLSHACMYAMELLNHYDIVVHGLTPLHSILGKTWETKMKCGIQTRTN